jgi:hypothetical protein
MGNTPAANDTGKRKLIAQIRKAHKDPLDEKGNPKLGHSLARTAAAVPSTLSFPPGAGAPGNLPRGDTARQSTPADLLGRGRRGVSRPASRTPAAAAERKCLPTDAFVASLEQGLRRRLKPEKPGPKPQERNHFTGGLFDELERNWVNCPRNSAEFRPEFRTG